MLLQGPMTFCFLSWVEIKTFLSKYSNGDYRKQKYFTQGVFHAGTAGKRGKQRRTFLLSYFASSAPLRSPRETPLRETSSRATHPLRETKNLIPQNLAIHFYSPYLLPPKLPDSNRQLPTALTGILIITLNKNNFHETFYCNYLPGCGPGQLQQ